MEIEQEDKKNKDLEEEEKSSSKGKPGQRTTSLPTDEFHIAREFSMLMSSVSRVSANQEEFATAYATSSREVKELRAAVAQMHDLLKKVAMGRPSRPPPDDGWT